MAVPATAATVRLLVAARFSGGKLHQSRADFYSAIPFHEVFSVTVALHRGHTGGSGMKYALRYSMTRSRMASKGQSASGLQASHEATYAMAAWATSAEIVNRTVSRSDSLNMAERIVAGNLGK